MDSGMSGLKANRWWRHSFDAPDERRLTVVTKRKRVYRGARHNTLEILAEYITEAGREKANTPCSLVGILVMGP